MEIGNMLTRVDKQEEIIRAQRQKQYSKTEASVMPQSWGADTVNFSAEGVAAAREMSKAQSTSSMGASASIDTGNTEMLSPAPVVSVVSGASSTSGMASPFSPFVSATTSDGEIDESSNAFFKSFMAEARGEVSSSGDPEEQLEELMDKLKDLQSQLSQAATNNSSTDVILAEVKSLQSQISAMTAQIAALKSQAKG